MLGNDFDGQMIKHVDVRVLIFFCQSIDVVHDNEMLEINMHAIMFLSLKHYNFMAN